MPDRLTDDIRRAAERAGIPLAAERPAQIAEAVAARLEAFAPLRAELELDTPATFEAALWACRYVEYP
ncbi:hypothetical protein [Pseudomonas sp. NPDC007930]|uniref:hypothetical protein n=1 Tax=Pseudomonas sp. NPDC007930 TaxID=3364417 RepID=UPI0036ECE967